MSRGGGLDLKLSLHASPPAARGGERASSPDEEERASSSPSSCLSSEGEQHLHHHHEGLQWSDSPGATPMVLAACARCLMYVMLSEADPRCPRCRSPVLLDFLHHAAAGSGRRSQRRPRRQEGLIKNNLPSAVARTAPVSVPMICLPIIGHRGTSRIHCTAGEPASAPQ